MTAVNQRMVRDTKRQNAPPDGLVCIRRMFGAAIVAALKMIGKSPEWLGRRVGYSTPSSMRQVINGHQGMSVAVYRKVIEELPVLAFVAAPPMNIERQGKGAPGPHKEHDYPPDTGRLFEKGLWE